MKSQNWLRWLPVFITVILLGSLISAYYLSIQVQDFTKEAWKVLTSEDRELISNWVSQFGTGGVLLVFIFFLVQMFAFILPSWFLIVVSVLAYGPIAGGIIALSGIILAASVAYLIGHLFGELIIQKIMDKKTEHKMKIYLDRYEFWLVAIFRLSPFLSDDAISYIAGLTSMSYSQFILATIIGSTPLIAIIGYLGETNERLINGFIIITIICIIGFIAYIFWDHKQQKKLLATQ